MRSFRPHRLVVPFTALLAVVLTVVLFEAFERKLGTDQAVITAAVIAFSITALIGAIFRPLLGE